MTVLVRKLVKWFYFTFAIVAICIALIVQAGRSFSHLLADYVPQINQYLSYKLNAKVSIGSLSAEWKGLKPLVDIKQLQIVSQTNQPIVAFSHAHMRLDLLDSFLHARLVWSSLKLNQVEIEFVQSRDGLWHVSGLPRVDEEDPENQRAKLDALLDMLLLSNQIKFDKSHFNFSFVSGEKVSLESPTVLMENAGSFHRLSLQVDVNEQPKTLFVVVEAQGDPRNKKNFSSNGFLQLNQFPTNEPIAAVTDLLLKGVNANVHSEGTLNSTIWFSSRPGREGFNVTGNLATKRLKLPIMGRSLALDSFSSDIVGYWLYSGEWRLALQNINANINQYSIKGFNLAGSAAKAEAPFLIQIPSLNLEGLNRALLDADFFGDGKLREAMSTLSPRGELRNIAVSIPLQNPSDWKLEANLVQVGNNALHGIPAINKLDGFVEAGKQGGHVDIDSRAGFSMHYSPTYTEAMEYEQAKGQVAWWLHPDKNQVYVNSGALHFKNGEEQAKGYMWIAFPWTHNTGDIDLYLQIGAQQLNASLYKKYTPAVVPHSLLSWLEKSVGDQNKGVASQAGFIFRGTLNSRNHNARSHQLYLDLDHADLKYHPEWPALEKIDGRLLLDDEIVNGTVENATLFASNVKKTQISVHANPQGQGALLEVKGAVQGPSSDGLKVLRESMLRRYIGAATDSWVFSGDMKTQVNLAIPLEQNAPGSQQQVDIDVASSSFRLGSLNLNMKDINGRVSYNQDTGLSSQNLKGTLFGEPAEAELSTQKQGDFSQTLVTVKGNVDSAQLAKWSQRPEVLFLQGKIPYDARVELNHRAKTKTSEQKFAQYNQTRSQVDLPFAVVKVRSELVGVAVDLPAPYGKSPEAPRELIFTMSLGDYSTFVDVTYDNRVNALLELEPRNKNKLHNAAIALNQQARLSVEPQFLLSGKLDSLDLEPWKKVLDRYYRYGEQLTSTSSNGLVAVDNFAVTDTVKNKIATSTRADEINVDSIVAGSISATKLVPEVKASDALVAGLPFHAALLLSQYQVGPLTLNNLDVHAERLADAWKIRFTNAIVLGDIRIANDSAKPLDIDLEHLHVTQENLGKKAEEKIPEKNDFIKNNSTGDEVQATSPLKNSEPDTASKIVIDVSKLPLANISVKELFVDDKSYGGWSLQMRPHEGGVLFDELRGTIRGITVSGFDDRAAGAKLDWKVSAQGTSTHFKGALSATDIAGVLQQWQKPDSLESKNALFTADLNWLGDPQDFSYKKFDGDINIFLEQGRFKRAPGVGSDGFLRLMAILNFDSLARRLRLDFSDLYQSGLAYDQISGKVNFEQGTMTFKEPLIVKTPSSRLQMAGKLDLEREKINTRLIATLPIAGNFTFFTALVTGLPAAAGVYLVSKLFKKQVDQATSVSYRIHGGWDDPQMNFDRLFESEESLIDSVNSDEMVEKDKRAKKTKKATKRIQPPVPSKPVDSQK
jgi:uncharacterized protein (TIGR02099 family)